MNLGTVILVSLAVIVFIWIIIELINYVKYISDNEVEDITDKDLKNFFSNLISDVDSYRNDKKGKGTINDIQLIYGIDLTKGINGLPKEKKVTKKKLVKVVKKPVSKKLTIKTKKVAKK